MRKKLARFLTNLARFALAIGLLALLFSRVDSQELTKVIKEASAKRGWLVAAAAMYGVVVTLGILRWQILLRAQDIRLPLRRTTVIYFIGMFFNAFLFGSTGGDLARLYYAAKSASERKTEAGVTIAMDRITGMLAMMVLATVVIACRWPFLRAQPETLVTALAVLVLAAVIPLIAAQIVILHRFRHARVFRWIQARQNLAFFLRKLLHSFLLYRHHPIYLASAFGLSLFGHLATICISAMIGQALGMSLGIQDYLVGVPIVLILASFPITPAGLGLREGLAVTVLGAFGVEKTPALSLALLIFAVTFVWSIFGGLVFLVRVVTAGRSLREQVRDIRETGEAM